MSIQSAAVAGAGTAIIDLVVRVDDEFLERELPGGRGNTTWSSNPDTKNPYRLKFADKVRPLGLPKGRSWVLLANKRAGSMLTNAYGMKAASLLGTVAYNHIIPVDLYVNGTFKGSYNLTEKVGFSSNSR